MLGVFVWFVRGKKGVMNRFSFAWLRGVLTGQPPAHLAHPAHLALGRLGEEAARRHLRRLGLKFLVANFRTTRGEIDLIFRDRDCLVFVEVKTRSSEEWRRPAAAVDQRKRRRLTRVALDYLRRLGNPSIKVRFDVVEVLLEGKVEGAAEGRGGAGADVREVRHWPNTFAMTPPYRYG
jgi:putative endonuclease